MTAKERVKLVYPRAIAKRYHLTGGGGYTLIWDGFGEKKRLGEGDTAAQAWKNVWKRIDGEQRRIQALRDADEKELARKEKALEECGWTRQDCGNWEDPITGSHEPASRAYEIATQRRAGVHPPKNIKRPKPHKKS